jgi:hypothetical protein
MAATIVPTGLGSLSYAITGSRAVLADLSLTFDTGMSYLAFRVRYVTAAAGVQIILRRGGVDLALHSGALAGVPLGPNRLVSTTISAVGLKTEIACFITATAGSPLAEPYLLKLSANASSDWDLLQDDNSVASPRIPRMMADPVAQITSIVPPAPKEKTVVTITAAPGISATNLVGPVPALTYRWNYTGTIAVSGFPTLGASQTKNFTSPNVYGSKTIDLEVQVWPTWDGGTTGEWLRAAGTSPATIEPKPQLLMFVLDRSGSMSGQRWDTAVVAARILAQMFTELRRGVDKNRVGILCFEDSACSWRSFWSPSPAIQVPLPIGKVQDAPDFCTLDLGMPGSCTPIGDGLLSALQLLRAEYGTAAEITADDPAFHVVLLTDGYENSGSTYLKSTPAAIAALAADFDVKKTSTNVGGVNLSALNGRTFFYPVGLGATVDDEVLNRLSFGSTGSPTVYRNVIDVSQIKAGIIDMLGFATDAQAVASAPDPLTVGAPADSASPGPSRYITVDPMVNRLVLACEWPPGTHTLELARYDSGSASYVVMDVNVDLCTKHGFASVDLASLYEGEAAVPQTFWRVVRKDTRVATVMADADFLAYVDLYVKADIVFNQREYQTGEQMVVTARLREGSEPIHNARVFVELARPGESLGTFLATNSQAYQPNDGHQGDQPPPKEDMLRQLLRARKLDGLNVSSPPSIFADGTNELFDDGTHADGAAGDGDFANVYTKVDKEGVYTFRFYAVGKLADGSAFNRVVTVSTWCGIHVDSNATAVTFTPLGPIGALTQVLVTVVPRDAGGEYLGPFRAEDIKITTSAGSFQGELRGEFDGRYTQVLSYGPNDDPQVAVIAQGRPFPPVSVRPKPGGPGDHCQCCCCPCCVAGPWLRKAATTLGQRLHGLCCHVKASAFCQRCGKMKAPPPAPHSGTDNKY